MQELYHVTWFTQETYYSLIVQADSEEIARGVAGLTPEQELEYDLEAEEISLDLTLPGNSVLMRKMVQIN
ncbi:hypothetical protein [Flavitalea sp.]|nr:hypothetical protein [Flavitalea sp.]